jgi:hypothetical protein
MKRTTLLALVIAFIGIGAGIAKSSDIDKDLLIPTIEQVDHTLVADLPATFDLQDNLEVSNSVILNPVEAISGNLVDASKSNDYDVGWYLHQDNSIKLQKTISLSYLKQRENILSYKPMQNAGFRRYHLRC